MITFLRKKIIFLFLFIMLPSLAFSQTVPYQSAPVNYSYWETTTPTLYWWYLSNPYSMGPFNYSVQVSTDPSNFTGAFLIVDDIVTTSTAGNYPIPASAGITVGGTYYWRIGVGGNYSQVWNFSPSTWGTGGGGVVITYYALASSAGVNGTITPLGALSIASGEDQTYTIIPSAGYEIADVEVDNVSVGAVSTYSFINVTSNHSISATFQLVPIITYVAVSGDDLNGDGSIGNPYRTIQRGINQTDDGGTVYVFNGNYAEDVNIQRPVTILGESNPSTSSFVIWESDVNIKNFEVYASTGSGPGPGIQKRGFQTWEYMENLTLENIECHNNDEQGLLLENIGNVLIKNCRFADNQMAGMAIINCNNVTIEDVGSEGNLKGFFVHNSTDITLNQVYVEDNGKIYPFNYPDQNGFTFTECENISITTLYSNRNEEQGFKFEDCSFITLTNVSASNNKTDGMAFINCTEITYNGGFANDNGEAIGDNGAEFVKCTNFVMNNFSSNDNFDSGIYLGTRYTGQYQYDIINPANSLRANEFIGMNSEVTFQTVFADGNLNGYGLNIIHTSFGEFNNLSMTNNLTEGLRLDASHHLTFNGGVFDNNEVGIFIFPEDHDHTPSHNIAQEEITSLSFLGTMSISNNALLGMGLDTELDVFPGAPVLDSPDTKIVEPFFNGTFSIYNNPIGMMINGEVIQPSFYGLHLKDDLGTTSGIVIGAVGGQEPEDILINNSIFDGYAPGRFAIDLGFAGFASKDVDAKHNIFAGAANDAAVESILNHDVDNPAMGLIDITGWTNGTSTFNIGSASAYTGALVTIPISIDQPVSAVAFNELEGLLTFNDLNLTYRYATTGTGTLFHDAGWTLIFDHSVSDELRFWAIGFNTISTSGTLFYLTFEVLDVNDGSVTVIADPLDIEADHVNNLFVVNNGTINYVSSPAVSLVSGDATLDFAVDLADYIAVVNHINLSPLTGQGLLNADVNNDGFINALDAANILSFIDHGIWPNTSVGGGSLIFASATVNQDGVLRFPFTLSAGTDVRSLEIELTYNESQVDYKSFVQLLCGDKYHVNATRVSDGVTRFIFSAADESDGYLVPAEIMFNIKGDPNAPIIINSTYSINGGDFEQGPEYSANGVTGVDNETLPENFSVSQNYPNPFNPSTSIEYSIPEKGLVTIKIYDILGRVVNTLVNEKLNAGYYSTTWNSVDNTGMKVSSGIYFYRVVNGANVVTKKMMLIK